VASGKLASDTFSFQHCKYAIIDNAVLIISSGNWGMTSCPPEQTDGDVKGNRDWWFVIYGDGNYVPGGDTVPWWVVAILAVIGGVFGIGYAVMRNKMKGR